MTFNIFYRQGGELIRSIKKTLFRTADDGKLQSSKHELLSQINTLDISIRGTGFFTLGRRISSGVSSTIS